MRKNSLNYKTYDCPPEKETAATHRHAMNFHSQGSVRLLYFSRKIAHVLRAPITERTCTGKKQE